MTPADPASAFDADNANPGAVEQVKAAQIQSKSGKYGTAQVKPYKPATKQDKAKKPSWIEIELVDMKDNPIPGQAYKIILADGETVAEGTLDDKGLARLDGIDPGTCKITFPDLDKDAWEKV